MTSKEPNRAGDVDPAAVLTPVRTITCAVCANPMPPDSQGRIFAVAVAPWSRVRSYVWGPHAVHEEPCRLVLDTPYDEDIGAGYELRGGLFLCSRATTPREERDARVWRVTLVGGAVLQVRAVDLFRDGDEVVFTTPSDTFPSANTFVASLPASSVAVIDGERHPYPPSDSTPAADAP